MYRGTNMINSLSTTPYTGMTCAPPQSSTSKWRTPYVSGQTPIDTLRSSSPLSLSCHTPVTGCPEYIRSAQRQFDMNCLPGYNIAKEPSVAAALDRIRCGGVASPSGSTSYPSFVQLQGNSPRCNLTPLKSKSCHDSLGIKPVPDLSPRFDAIIAGNIPLTPKTSTNFSGTPVLLHGETRCSSHSPGRNKNFDSQHFYRESRDDRSPQFQKHILDSSPRKVGRHSLRHSSAREPLARQDNRYSRRNFRSKR